MGNKSSMKAGGILSGGLTLSLLLTACLDPADEILIKSGEASRIIFVRENSAGEGVNRNNAMGNNTDEFYAGTDLFSLSPIGPTGKLVNLTAKWTRLSDNPDRWGAAQDPEVSFDGEHILFSMKTSSDRAVHWHLYEMDVNGDNLVQLTSDPNSDDMDPAYLPDGRVVFTSTRSHQVDEYERRSVSNLYIGTRGDGGKLGDIRQLSFNQSHDFNPWVHSSGLIYFSRWDHLGSPNKVPLFTIHPDGTKQFVLYGADETFQGNGNGSGSRTFMEARELSDGGIVTSLMERTSRFEGGAIAILDLGGKPITAPPDVVTPSESPYNTTRNISDAIYKTPYPIRDGVKERLLVAMSPHETGPNVENEVANYDLYVMDKDGGNRKLVFASSQTNDYDPIVVAPRAVPKTAATDPFVAKGIASGAVTGGFFDADVYSRMDNDGQMKPDRDWTNHDGSKGQAKFVRFLDAVSMPRDGNMRGGSLGETEFEKQRVIGYGPVQSDGSFALEVPANRSLHLQVLDEDGVMLVNQLQWVHVMQGERRVCTGCHGPRESDKSIFGFSVAEDGAVTSEAEGMEATKSYIASFANAAKVTEHRAAKTDTLDFFNPAQIQRAIDSANTVRDKKTWDPSSGDYAFKGKTLQAILDQQCVSCHSSGEAVTKGGGLVLEEIRSDSIWSRERVSSVYDRLMREDGYRDTKGNRQPYVTSRGARRSPLAWVLFNRQLVFKKNDEKVFRIPSYDHSGLWEKDSSGFIDTFAPANEDLLTLIEWMDMGAQFSNSVGKY